VTRFIARRLLFAVVLVVVLSSAALALARLAPGDFAVDQLGLGAHQDTVARARAEYGLDRPFVTQYTDWMRRAVRFDFGMSLKYGRPVRDLIPERAANTAIIAVSALLVATLVGLPLGVITGSRRNVFTRLVQTITLAMVSMPPLLTSLFLAFVASRTGWASVGGMWADDAPVSEVFRHLAVPVLALAIPVTAIFERMQAQAMSEVITQPYIVAALARGVPRARIIWRDGLKAAIRPVVSLYGVVMATLLSGSFVVEAVTPWPGLGLLMLDALRAHDPYLIAGCAGTGALLLAIGTLLGDIALASVDPRATEA
jgi:peptide/nickel transport system permease protein